MRVLRGNVLKIGVSMAALLTASAAATTSAQAGGFAVREQSAYYQGMSFAGSAAGTELSSMFWNSAAAAAAPGFNAETHAALVIPHTEITATGGDLSLVPGLESKSGNIGDPTLVPASYTNYQINDQWFIGLASNAQYGLSTKPDNLSFAGTPISTTARIFSINFNPTIAYKVTPEFTIGVGAQILYADVRLRSSNSAAITGSGFDGRQVDADDWGFGATAGVIWQPAPGTSIGVGYRSSIDLTASGTCKGFGLSNVAAGSATGCIANPNVKADLTLPDLVTASFSQRVSERFTLLGTVEWTNWSTVGAEAEFKSDGQTVDVFPLGYDDGWFFSGGVEYEYTPYTTFRAGLGYEISPIDDEVRSPALPDNDRVWLSFGATTKLTENATIDLAYTHLFVKDAPITVEGGTGSGVLLEAEGTGDIDIISASFKYKFGAAAPALEPLK